MNVLMLGLSHATAPLEVRERVAFSGEGLATGLSRMMGYPGLLEGVILSTCNRTELYAVATDPAQGHEALRTFMVEDQGVPAGIVTQYFQRLEGEVVTAHLFRTAAGLESQIVGEGQILAQVRDAQAVAQAQRTLGGRLGPLFRYALKAGKRVRSETEISRGAVSISSAAVEQAREALGGLDGKVVMILGSGKAGELAAHLLSSCNPGTIFVANRTLESAQKLASQIGGQAIPFHAMQEALERIDMLFCSTGAPHYVLTANDLTRVFERRNGRPLLIFDVSVPRNIDPAIAHQQGVSLYDVDDLQSVAIRNRAERLELVQRAEAIVNAEIEGYRQWLEHRRMTPAISSLLDEARALREQELVRFWSKHGHGFTPEQRHVIERMTQSLMNKFLHQPLVSLKGLGAYP